MKKVKNYLELRDMLVAAKSPVLFCIKETYGDRKSFLTMRAAKSVDRFGNPQITVNYQSFKCRQTLGYDALYNRSISEIGLAITQGRLFKY